VRPTGITGIRAGVRRLFRLPLRTQAIVRADADAELESLLDERTEYLMLRGMSPTEARAEAVRHMGTTIDEARQHLHRSAEQRERRMHLRETTEGLLQDLRYATRGLRAHPAFTLAVVVTLGLGIGANAAMFSVVDRILFRPPPMLKEPALTHRIYLGTTNRGTENLTANLPIGRYLDLARTTSSFTRFAQFTRPNLAVGRGSDLREMGVGAVTASFFDFFDAPSVLGRNFTVAEDSVPSGTPVVVISYSYWQAEFGGHRDALGATMRIGPLVYTIIGVEPAGFAGVWPDQPPVAYIPLSSYASTLDAEAAGERWWTNYHSVWSTTMAMRKPGVSVATASADLTNQYRASYAAELLRDADDPPMEIAKPRGLAASILAERGPNISQLTRVATWIGGVALIVLLIACANVANLLLARALNRKREIAVRFALGVSRRRLLTLLFTESLLLALFGGAAGIAVAQAASGVLRAAFIPKSAPMNVAADPRTVLFAALAALVVGIVTGLAPALQLGRVSLTDDLKAGAREGTYRRSPLRLGLLVLQGALSVVLLVGAGLFVRSLSNVRDTRLGYDVDPVLVLDLRLRDVALDAEQTRILKEKLLADAKALPEVANASRQVSVPFRGSMINRLYIAGIDTVSKLGDFSFSPVSPEYFATLGTRIIRGRGIADADRPGAPGAMVVSQQMAKRLWPNADAIGQCVKFEVPTAPCTYVVGIAEDTKSRKLDDSSGEYYYYLAIAQFKRPDFGGLFVRTRGNNGADFAESIRRGLQPDMPGGSYLTATPLADILGGETASWSLGASMFLAFGTLALVLAAIGLFSVISYNVAQRKHELGVRVALGAQHGDLVRLVVGEGMRLGLIGVGLGGVAAFASGRWIAPLLFKESPHDPVVFGVVMTVLLIVAFVASLIPARRAASVDPNQALRSD
jgi:putative ABC transport system permease protein